MSQMLIEIDSKSYTRFFPSDPNPFISGPFTELNQGKVERIVLLVQDKDKPGMGLVAGIKDGMIRSPFSAPFGGFHYKHENIYASDVDAFVSDLKDYILSEGLKGIELTLPPDLYHSSFNAKCISALLRSGYQSQIPDVTSWINLDQFQGTFSHRNSREYYKQSLRKGLVFNVVSDPDEKKEVYTLISENRARYGRPIFMSFGDVCDASALWPTDFFKVTSADNALAASGIFYRSHPEIIYALFWGDNETGRPLRAMDFLAFNLWSYYKELGFKYIDLGISCEDGIPNDGLLRFKESHNGTSSLRYSFSWSNPDIPK